MVARLRIRRGIWDLENRVMGSADLWDIRLAISAPGKVPTFALPGHGDGRKHGVSLLLQERQACLAICNRRLSVRLLRFQNPGSLTATSVSNSVSVEN